MAGRNSYSKKPEDRLTPPTDYQAVPGCSDLCQVQDLDKDKELKVFTIMC